MTLVEEITGLQQRLCFNASVLAHSCLTQKYECVRDVFVSLNVKVGVSQHCAHVYLQCCACVMVLDSEVVKLLFRDSDKKKKQLPFPELNGCLDRRFWAILRVDCVFVCVCVSSPLASSMVFLGYS